MHGEHAASSGRGDGNDERRAAGAWEALEVRVAAVAVDASEAAAQAARVKAALVKLEQAGDRTSKRVTVLEEVLTPDPTLLLYRRSAPPALRAALLPPPARTRFCSPTSSLSTCAA